MYVYAMRTVLYCTVLYLGFGECGGVLPPEHAGPPPGAGRGRGRAGHRDRVVHHAVLLGQHLPGKGDIKDYF